MQRDHHDDSTETIAEGPRQRQRQREREAPPARLGRYVILSELGRGGMSVVYVAYDPDLDRRVALKVVRGDRLSKAHRARLHREAQAIARLSHANVVTVFDVGDLADDTFVAMELIDGMSLREWIKAPRTWREVVRVVVAAGRGLAAAHAAGILHRDVKPDNIVIATSGAVKLVDFGLARDLGDRTADSGEHPPDDLDLAAGSLDNSSQASGVRPGPNLASGSHPSGSLPSGSQASGSQASGVRPGPNLASGSHPSGSLPSGSHPSGSHPSGSHPSGSHPSASHPSGSHPSGSHPSGSHASISGSSRPLETITRVGNVVGTPAYMPPEARSRHAESDERSDQFSLCATLYEALYRQKPFSVSRKGLLDRQAQPTVADDPTTDTRTLAAPPPRNTDVPAWLQRVVSRGLAVEPSQRYPSVEALLAELDRDPQRTRRRVAIAGGALIAVAAVATLVTSQMMARSQGAAAPTCDTGDDRVAAVWNPARRAAMHAAAAASGLPWAAGAIDAFGARVDKYGAEWKAMYEDACHATRVRLVQSAEALDLRTACLDRRLESLGELVTLMTQPTPGMLRNAGTVVDNLPKVADCADVKALRQIVRRPIEPQLASRLDVVDRNLAKLSALYAIGDVTKTLELADRVIADATAIGYPPPLAQALYWRGRAMADRGDGPAAEEMFDKTFAAALGAGEDQMAADAASRIAQEALWTARLADFQRWQRVAHALAARSGAHAVVVFNDQLACMANHWTGKPKTRLACLQELARRPGVRANEWLVTTLGIAASEAGQPAEAIRWLEQGVELARAENGNDHPRTLEMRAYLCQGLNRLGDYSRAAAECRDALARLAKSAPDDKLLEARLQLYVGEAELELKHPELARPLLEAALAAGDDEVKLQARTELSGLAGTRGDATAAVAAQRAALAETIKVYEPFNPRHPNIVAVRHELGIALLAQGDATAAAAELARADADAEVDEISPLELAQLRFARAQAVLRARPAARDEARTLAADALALYADSAPDTERFRRERRSIEDWITKLDGGSR